MDRKQIFPGQIPLETDLLGTNKNVMIALGKLSAAVFGAASYVNGLTTGPNSPAALNVVVQPGELYSLQNIDGTAYSSIAADTTHQIVKQGILLDSTTLSTPAPATAGFSINYLIQAAFSEVDTDAVVLPYYNATNPTQAYSGPANAGTTNNTTRKDTIILSAKAGIAATTGTQTTPAPDAGYIGLYVVTVANSQTTVTAPNITQLATAPIIPDGVIPASQSGAYAYAVDTGTANVYQAAYAPAITLVKDGMVLKFKAAHANTGASTFSPNGLTAVPIWGGDHAALNGGEIVASGDVWLQWNTSLNGTGAWVLVDSTGAPLKASGFIPSGSAVVKNGMYLPAANTVGFAANSVEQFRYTQNAFQWGTTGRTENFSVYKPGGSIGDLVANLSGCVTTYLVTGAAGSAATCAMNVAATISNGRSINAGGTIQASGADYAEYMRKATDCGTVAKGQIVGVTANGEITDKWSESIHFMVKSTNPNLVGGDTWAAHLTRPTDPDSEDADAVAEYRLAMIDFEAALEEARKTVDRIAYAGQVPVNVIGATAGDYIVPVMDETGIKGIAVSAPTFDQYRVAVGKVEAIEADGRARIIVKAV